MAMLYPTYQDLMDKVNEQAGEGTDPEVKSRYSIVIAAAKRARHLVDRDLCPDDVKPLSEAVEEMYEGKIKIHSPKE